MLTHCSLEALSGHSVIASLLGWQNKLSKTVAAFPHDTLSSGHLNLLRYPCNSLMDECLITVTSLSNPVSKLERLGRVSVSADLDNLASDSTSHWDLGWCHVVNSSLVPTGDPFNVLR